MSSGPNCLFPFVWPDQTRIFDYRFELLTEEERLDCRLHVCSLVIYLCFEALGHDTYICVTGI